LKLTGPNSASLRDPSAGSSPTGKPDWEPWLKLTGLISPDAHRSTRIISALLAVLVSLIGLVGIAAVSPEAQALDGGTLLLFDRGGQYSRLGEAHATMTANLITRYQNVTARPVDTYQQDDLDGFDRLVYVGSLYADNPLPTALLDDVLATTKPVFWMGNNLWWLTWRQDLLAQSFSERFGFTWSGFTTVRYPEISYRGGQSRRATSRTSLKFRSLTSTKAIAIWLLPIS
jgi:hypothetical protein